MSTRASRFLTDCLPWRFIVPRRNFIRNLKIASRVPEVKHQINRQAALRLAEYAWYAVLSPLLLIVAALYVLQGALVWFLKPGRFPITPPFDDWQNETAKEAQDIVPMEVIRDRMGGEVPRILSKKPS